MVLFPPVVLLSSILVQLVADSLNFRLGYTHAGKCRARVVIDGTPDDMSATATHGLQR
jgi:hypothetical protein